jgi:radical SAM superfamily enzyme YgiQ (UPF0313 family)
VTAKRRVTTVELSVYDNTVPLVAGYLQTYAAQDPLVTQRYEFDIYSRGLRTEVTEIVGELLARGSDIYAFSCYVWNMGSIRRALETLLGRRPDAWYILGGPQVMRHAAEYVPRGTGQVVVCNGEGERPFYQFLCEVINEEPDFSNISGVSFWSGDVLVSTQEAPRLRVLDDLPSPFAAGIFDGGEYTFSVLETNRGCPYNCGFCSWGAATNSKVYMFDEARVRDDVRWIAENCVSSVLIADANWGIAPRDVELSKHIVRCKEEFGFPTSLVITAAKNKPHRVAEITDVLVRGGLVTSQPISLQTMTPDALRLVERENIRESTFIELQKTLDDRNVSSFIELIWPLPGETLQTFREGVGRLCRIGAGTLTVYPQLLLHNTALYERRDALGLQMARAPDPCAEADVVTATAWVSPAECVTGTWFYYALHVLYNARSAYYLSSYLDYRGLQSYEDFFTAAACFMQERDDEVSRFVATSVSTADNYDMLNIGKVAYLVLHSLRDEVDHLLRDFASTQPWWHDRGARCALDIDLAARPYIYNEPVRLPDVDPAEISWMRESATQVRISLPAGLAPLAAELGLTTQSASRLRLEHPSAGKMPVPRMWDMQHNAGYCHVMIQRIRTLMPTWTALGREEAVSNHEPCLQRQQTQTAAVITGGQ